MSSKLDGLKPQKKIELFSGTYFAACTIGGVIGECRSFQSEFT
jgi:solute carrier family 25 phosphate transporter 3